MKIRNLLLACALLPWMAATAQTAKSTVKPVKQPFVAMFYNVENFYDTVNDPNKDDDEFTPQGKIPWTGERLNTKIAHIGQVITDITAPSIPDIVGFAEVENQQVLEMLTSSAALKKIKYSIVHYDSPDERGIDVALLYNPLTFTVISSEPIKVVLPENDKTRDILYVKGKLKSGKVLNVFINHWPSRREGKEKTDAKRMAAAAVLKAKIDELQKMDKSPNILVMGDFNDEPADKSIADGLHAVTADTTIANNNLYGLLYPEFKKGEGSLYYNDWDLFDQIIVSGTMLLNTQGIKTSISDAGIFKADYLLYKDKSGVMKPNRTAGAKYFGGYSDHLPVYVKFHQ